LNIKPINTEEHNQNTTKVNHFKEIIYLTSSIFGIAIFIYWASIFALDNIVDSLSAEKELQVFSIIKKSSQIKMPGKELPQSQRLIKAQEVLNELIEQSTLKGRSIDIKVIPGQEINAFAMVGDTILLVNELLKRVESENELAMVLAHELGHFFYRHHLKMMGRNLVMGVFSTFVFGNDNSLSKFFLGGLTYADRKFSRDQEGHCDLYGVELVYKKYSHLNGATSFFERLNNEKGPLEKYLSTHPLSEKRIEKIKKLARKKNYSLKGDLTSLPPIEE
jgi:beta-barrel assembly-enhancing protease